MLYSPTLPAEFPKNMVIYYTSDDILKVLEICGHFGEEIENSKNLGKFWKKLKVLENLGSFGFFC